MTPIRRLVEHMLSRIKPDLVMEGASHTAVDLGRSAVIEEAAHTTPNLKSFMEQKANTISRSGHHVAHETMAGASAPVQVSCYCHRIWVQVATPCRPYDKVSATTETSQSQSTITVDTYSPLRLAKQATWPRILRGSETMSRHLGFAR